MRGPLVSGAPPLQPSPVEGEGEQAPHSRPCHSLNMRQELSHFTADARSSPLTWCSDDTPPFRTTAPHQRVVLWISIYLTEMFRMHSGWYKNCSLLALSREAHLEKVW